MDVRPATPNDADLVMPVLQVLTPQLSATDWGVLFKDPWNSGEDHIGYLVGMCKGIIYISVDCTGMPKFNSGLIQRASLFHHPREFQQRAVKAYRTSAASDKSHPDHLSIHGPGSVHNLYTINHREGFWK